MNNRHSLLIIGGIAATYAALLAILTLGFDWVSYDMFNHMAFATHYARDWFSTTIPWLGGGLDISSYPPMAFQLVALLSMVPLVSLKAAYIMVLSGFTAVLGYSAALLLRQVLGLSDTRTFILAGAIAFSPALLKTVLAYGQFTTVVGLSFGFFGLFLFQRYIDTGDRSLLPLLSLALMLTAFSHHFSAILTLLLLSTFTLLNYRKTLLDRDRILPLAATGIVTAGIVVAVLLPVIRSVLTGDAIHAPIPHMSRTPFKSANGFDLFVLTSYGPLVAGFLYPLLRRRTADMRVYAAAVFFGILGLGYATPLPRLLFNGLAHWLTYDRFTLVAALLLTGLTLNYLLEHIQRRHLLLVLGLAFILTGLYTSLHAHTLIFGNPVSAAHTEQQRDATLDFLQRNASPQYRYQTFGYGAPIGDLYLYTDVPTLDTIYYSGRTVPWVAESGNGEIDAADRQLFEAFIRNARDVSVRYVFTFSNPYDRWMELSGWNSTGIGPGVTLWENPAQMDPAQTTTPPRHANILFGTAPLLSFTAFLLLLIRRHRQRETLSDY